MIHRPLWVCAKSLKWHNLCLQKPACASCATPFPTKALLSSIQLLLHVCLGKLCTVCRYKECAVVRDGCPGGMTHLAKGPALDQLHALELAHAGVELLLDQDGPLQVLLDLLLQLSSGQNKASGAECVTSRAFQHHRPCGIAHLRCVATLRDAPLAPPLLPLGAKASGMAVLVVSAQPSRRHLVRLSLTTSYQFLP